MKPVRTLHLAGLVLAFSIALAFTLGFLQAEGPALPDGSSVGLPVQVAVMTYLAFAIVFLVYALRTRRI
jgi:hypothetical protein